MYVLSSAQMKKAEEYIHTTAGVTYYTMMFMAGSKCARFISEREKKSKVVCVMCGRGKNGGDGFVTASELERLGFKKIFVILENGETTEPISKKVYEELLKTGVYILDAKKNLPRCVKACEDADIIVDALFGIGFKGDLKGNAADLVVSSNINRKAHKYALDIPSGLSAEETRTNKLYFKTDITLTMSAFKPVNVIKPYSSMCGKTYVMSLGFQPEDIERFAERYTVLDDDEVLGSIARRRYDSHKGDFGKVLVISGSRNFTGCAYFCNTAAAEIGAGIVTAAFPEGIYTTLSAKINEPILLPLGENSDGRIKITDEKAFSELLKGYSAVAAGSGIGADSDTKRLVEILIENCACPLVLDADALNVIKDDPSVLKKARCPVLITPHPGEMARLTKMSVRQITEHAADTASDFASKYGVFVLLKGCNTFIASPEGRLVMNMTGDPGMSRGGSGDVLTGIIAGLIPQTKNLFTAAAVGAYIHGAAGDYVMKKYGILSVTPTRVLENLHRSLKKIENI